MQTRADKLVPRCTAAATYDGAVDNSIASSCMQCGSYEQTCALPKTFRLSLRSLCHRITSSIERL
jgi:hypothetical protein